MSENDSAQEKTEDATAKRLQEAREKGQVARSRELGTFVVMITGAIAVMATGGHISNQVIGFAKGSMKISREVLFQDTVSVYLLMSAMSKFLDAMLPIFFIVFVAAFFGPMLLSGWNFSVSALAFKTEKLNPLNGLKRMFSTHALMELAKALAKFLSIGIVSAIAIWTMVDSFIALGYMPVEAAIVHGAYLLAFTFFITSTSLIILAAVDVPFQIWDHAKKLRMTKQEVKDEYKNVEGKPEVKARVRQIQRELAKNRMMQEVPQADVVVTNPTHFSVALKYDPTSLGAPVVIAKGVDNVAMKIREIADSYEIPIVSAPPLARALYHTTELETEVPEGLYIAVAQILAYVYQLKRYKRGQASKPRKVPNDVPIPDEFYFKEDDV